MTPLQLLFLGVFGLAAVWFGWRVFRTKSMVRSALSLLAAMVALRSTFNPEGRCSPSKMLPTAAGCIERNKPGHRASA